ncbi:hypothetical protein DFH09DRAFT_1093973 [Mycena vulgaris]|nr:hypothetical protein DFH09DRAFT_1093973 [Mycena vulgaris]
MCVGEEMRISGRLFGDATYGSPRACCYQRRFKLHTGTIKPPLSSNVHLLFLQRVSSRIKIYLFFCVPATYSSVTALFLTMPFSSDVIEITDSEDDNPPTSANATRVRRRPPAHPASNIGPMLVWNLTRKAKVQKQQVAAQKKPQKTADKAKTEKAKTAAKAQKQQDAEQKAQKAAQTVRHACFPLRIRITATRHRPAKKPTRKKYMPANKLVHDKETTLEHGDRLPSGTAHLGPPPCLPRARRRAQHARVCQGHLYHARTRRLQLTAHHACRVRYRGARVGAGAGYTKGEIERALTGLQMAERVHLLYADTVADAVVRLYDLSADLGIKPHKLIKRSHLPFCPHGDLLRRHVDEDAEAGESDDACGGAELGVSSRSHLLNSLYYFPTASSLSEAYQHASDARTRDLTVAGCTISHRGDGAANERLVNRALSQVAGSVMYGVDPLQLAYKASRNEFRTHEIPASAELDRPRLLFQAGQGLNQIIRIIHLLSNDDLFPIIKPFPKRPKPLPSHATPDPRQARYRTGSWGSLFGA